MTNAPYRYAPRRLPPSQAKPAALLSSHLRELAAQLQADGALIYWNYSLSRKRYTGFEARFSDGRQAIGVEEHHD